MLRVGLTGGIACGKSEVVRRLAAAGLPTLDLDGVAHALMGPGQPGHAAVAEAFGSAILASDGSIDRRALGAIVFADPEARRRLNGILHPRIRAEEARRASLIGDRPGALLVTDAALLVETGVHLRFDRLIVVHCRPDQQVARLLARDGLSEEEAGARLAAQMPIATKVRFAHLEVDTSGTIEETHRAGSALARELEHLAQGRPTPFAVPEARARGLLVHGSAEGPGGLTPAGLTEQIAVAGGVELEPLAAQLRPRVAGPWYAAADAVSGKKRGEEAQSSPAALVGPVVLHELRAHGFDPERLGAAAHSLAWLTDRSADRIAGAVLFALLLAEVVTLGRVPADLQDRAARFEPLARRWGRSGPDRTLAFALAAALSHPEDPEAARGACARAGGDPGLAGALVGAAVGA